MTERLVAFQIKWARSIVAGTILLCAISGYFARRLELRTDLAELLPDRDPSVKELRRVQAKLQGMSALIVNVHSPDPKANMQFADDLSRRLRAEPKDLIEVAISNVKPERAWFESHNWLYASAPDLEELRQHLRAEIDKRKNPLFVDIDDDQDELEDLKARLGRGDGEMGALARLPDDHLATKDGTTAMVLVVPPGGLFHEHAGEKLAARTKTLIAELNPSRYGPLQVSFSGEVQASIEEREALESDLIWATSTCVVLVCVVVVAFFRKLRAIPLIAAPALVGTSVAFGFAYFVFGYLNSSTAFLGSIIVGNGINYAIIQLARYAEERRAGASPEVALTCAVRGTLRATGVAALAASFAYGSLVLTHFRGFSQFGTIGEVGMLLAWLATIVVLPSVLWLLDGRRGDRPSNKERGPLVASRLARICTGRPTAFVALGAIISVMAGRALLRYMKDPFEYNFRNLHSARSEKLGEARFNRINQEVFGRALTPIVVLATDDRQAASIQEALRRAKARDGNPSPLSDVVTIDDFLPGGPFEQKAKLAIIDEIRRMLDDPLVDTLGKKARAQLAQYRPPDLSLVDREDLPALVRRPFTEVDGTVGRVVLAFTRPETYDVWNGRDMLRLATLVGEIRLPDGHIARSSGSAVIFAGMIRAIVHDGPPAIVASFVGVGLLVLVLSQGFLGAMMVLGTLGMGVLWMMGAAALLDVRLNFLNFVAIPITIGIGVDYGINIYLRARSEGPGRVAVAVGATGAAVALCSATTIIGYGALLVADNRGLRSFGTLAILGELACLAAALVFMPALLAIRDRRTRAKSDPAR